MHHPAQRLGISRFRQDVPAPSVLQPRDGARGRPQHRERPRRQQGEHEPGHQVRVSEREIDSDLAPHRAGHDHRALERGGVENGHGIRDRRPPLLRLVAGLAVATHVERHTAMSGAQALHDVVPAAPIVDAGVDQQDVCAVLDPAGVVGDPGASRGDEHGAHPSSSRPVNGPIRRFERRETPGSSSRRWLGRAPV